MNWVLICFAYACFFKYTFEFDFEMDGSFNIGRDIFRAIANFFTGNGHQKQYLRAEVSIDDIKNDPQRLLDLLNLKGETNNETDYLIALIIENQTAVEELIVKYNLDRNRVATIIERYKIAKYGVNETESGEHYVGMEDDPGAMPFNKVPFEDQDLVRPDTKDRNLVVEGMAVRKKVMTELDEVIEEVIRSFPDPTDPRLPGITKGLRDEYNAYFDMLIDRLFRTKHYPLVRKYQQWLDFRDQVDTMYTKVASKWINKYMQGYYGYQRSFDTLHERIKERLHALKHEEFDDMCRTYEICRSVHAFSDYLEEFLAELIAMNNSKVDVFIKAFANSVSKTEYYLHCDDDNLEQIENYKNNTRYFTRDYIKVMSMVRRTIVNRHRPLESVRHSVANETQIFRRILHYIDSAYYKREKVWDEVANNLREWANNRGDISAIIDGAIINFVKYYQTWPLDIRTDFKRDVNALIKLLANRSVLTSGDNKH